MQLTLERLNGEYLSWAVEFGEGRNNSDIRFGQMIHNKYDLPGKVDVYYIESTEKAYHGLLSYIEEDEIQNIL
jgi:hypothetical protein